MSSGFFYCYFCSNSFILNEYKIILMKKIGFLFVILICNFSFSQKVMHGQVIDYDTTVPIAFVKISYNNKITTSNWEGKFSIEIKEDNKPIVFNYKGYYEKTHYLTVGAKSLLIKMVTDNSLKDQEIYSENQVNLIVKKVIESKSKNQPEKALKSYEYKNYEHLLVSANPDSISKKIDTILKKNLFGRTKIKLDSSNYKFKKLSEKQHLYQTEKVNLIQFNNKTVKETVLASRMAGFKKPLYEYLGLNLVSYSLYDNQIDILGVSVHNPISNYGRKLYVFKIIDTIKVNDRTAYRIYFQPKKLKSNRIRGLMYVDAENFAVCKSFFRIYGIVNINALYTFEYQKENAIWFPKKRKINVVKGNNADDINILGGTIKFNSGLEGTKKDASDQTYLTLESTPYDIKINKEVAFKNPKIKIEVPDASMNKPDNYWRNFEKDTLDKRKIRTYINLDSLSVAEKIEHKIILGKKIFNGYFPISIVDLDLRTLFKYNNYEGFRLGIGGTTNNKLSENYKISGYFAYGFKDDKFKYGITPSYLLDKQTNTWISASYSDDLKEIGQIQFATENKRFRIYDPRPINISTFYNQRSYSAYIESKYFAKTDTYFGFSRNEIETFANENAILWREDSSNASDKYLRNKLRHDVVPILKELNPSFLSSFEKTVENLKQSQSMIDDASKLVYKIVVEENENELKINLKELLKLPNYNAYLYQWLKDYGFNAWNDIYDLVHAQSGKQVFSEDFLLLKDRFYLILSPKNDINRNQIYDIDKNFSQVNIPLKFDFCNVGDISISDSNSIFVDEDQLKFPLQLRKWQEGDVFHPFGMQGSKKVSKYFKDEKLSLIDKLNKWLLCSDDQIVWIVGMRQDERFKVTTNTTKILKITIQ